MSEPSILDRIVAQRRLDVAKAKEAVSKGALLRQVQRAPSAIDFLGRLQGAGPVAVIAEIKRASPSKGDIAPGTVAAELGQIYAEAGAAGISVLTEPTWFKGSLQDMLDVRLAVDNLGADRPGILRKDFIVDDYQVLEARAFGADAVLFIVACLDDSALGQLLACAESLGMAALVEVNNAQEMRRGLTAGASLIGTNNRDLRSFKVDLGTTDRLAGLVPENVFLVALSGVGSRADVERFEAVGARAVLVGESLMLAPDPGAKLEELLQIHDSRFTIHDSGRVAP